MPAGTVTYLFVGLRGGVHGLALKESRSTTLTSRSTTLRFPVPAPSGVPARPGTVELPAANASHNKRSLRVNDVAAVLPYVSASAVFACSERSFLGHRSAGCGRGWRWTARHRTGTRCMFRRPARRVMTSVRLTELGFPVFATKNTTRIGGADPSAAAAAQAAFPVRDDDTYRRRRRRRRRVDEGDGAGARVVVPGREHGLGGRRRVGDRIGAADPRRVLRRRRPESPARSPHARHRPPGRAPERPASPPCGGCPRRRRHPLRTPRAITPKTALGAGEARALTLASGEDQAGERRTSARSDRLL